MTDPQLIAVVLGKDSEIEKSIESVYSYFNVVRSLACAPLPALHVSL